MSLAAMMKILAGARLPDWRRIENEPVTLLAYIASAAAWTYLIVTGNVDIESGILASTPAVLAAPQSGAVIGPETLADLSDVDDREDIE